MRAGKLYIPCLRWKQGEYQAIMRLSSSSKDSILPIIEVAEFTTQNPEYSFDFESGKPPKTLEEHLSKFAPRVKGKWGTDECFVDLRHIEVSSRLNNGQHPVTFIFDDLRLKGVEAIPVVGFEQDYEYLASVREAVKLDNRGFCLRTSLEKITRPDSGNRIDQILSEINIKPSQCDFIFDIDAPPNFEPLDVFADLLESIITNMPYLNSWRSFGIIGTSFPPSLSGVKSGVSIIPRNEWRLYKDLFQRFKRSNIRIPTFGDYVISHPEVLDLDMKYVKPKANIRYTINDGWLIARGDNVRDYGLGQHKALCDLVIKSKEYCGVSFSEADKYIYDCAQGKASTGNMSTWRWVGTNHHLEMIARDLANLCVS